MILRNSGGLTYIIIATCISEGFFYIYVGCVLVNVMYV